MTKRITLTDVAAHAGVSRATASLVLRGTGNIPESTRERVRASIQALGYVYHRAAASLRTSRTDTVGLILPDPAYPFMVEMTIGLESVFTERGLLLLTANAFEDPARQDRLLQAMTEHQVDGLVVIPAFGTCAAFAQKLERCGIPTVVTIRAEATSRSTYVGIDNVHGGRIAGEHLLDHGCRRFAWVGGLDGQGSRRDRLAGLRGALDGRGARLVADCAGPALGRWARGATAELFRERPLPDAVVCHNDSVAFGLYRALRDVAPHAIDQVRVVSFDDVDEAALWEPPISSIAANGREMGRRAAAALLRLIDDPAAGREEVLLQPQLVARRSCGCG